MLGPSSPGLYKQLRVQGQLREARWQVTLQGQEPGPSSSSGRELSGGYLVCLCAILSTKSETGRRFRRVPCNSCALCTAGLHPAAGFDVSAAAESSIFPKK